MRLRSSQVQPDPSGHQSLASTQRVSRQGKGSKNNYLAPIPLAITGPVPQDILEQQAAAYVEAVHLLMIAQGIPLEIPRTTGNAGPDTRVPVFDRLGPPPPALVNQEDLRARLVKSVVEVPPK